MCAVAPSVASSLFLPEQAGTSLTTEQQLALKTFFSTPKASALQMARQRIKQCCSNLIIPFFCLCLSWAVNQVGCWVRKAMLSDPMHCTQVPNPFLPGAAPAMSAW